MDPLHQYDYRNEGPRNSALWHHRYLLALEDVTAVFDGFKALDITDLAIGHNELRVVVGPNGAGKTTMCDVISGKTRPASGKVHFDGREITQDSETDIALSGVGRKFQIPNVFDSLTVYENILLSLPRYQGVFASIWEKESAEERDRILSILERVRLLDFLHHKAKNLSHGQRQWLAISALIIASPKLLLVDEPAAGLTDAETALTAELLLELKEQHTIICIEHDMEFVRQLGSRVTVLNEGRVLAEGTLAEVQANEQVIEAYLGR
ncbi:MAG: urea ABC transporter ATP-binding protein UrtD [Planctomycetes bacterium]|nr:urea ABC transporter ATP-binding protein UrtD [Planctomycetota bacterium]